MDPLFIIRFLISLLAVPDSFPTPRHGTNLSAWENMRIEGSEKLELRSLEVLPTVNKCGHCPSNEGSVTTEMAGLVNDWY